MVRAWARAAEQVSCARRGGLPREPRLEGRRRRWRSSTIRLRLMLLSFLAYASPEGSRNCSARSGTYEYKLVRRWAAGDHGIQAIQCVAHRCLMIAVLADLLLQLFGKLLDGGAVVVQLLGLLVHAHL